MYFNTMGKLNRRRKGLLEEGEKGFTLIELLVVVIIIGILAAIAIPVYLGIQNNAKDSAVQSDLTNAKTAVVSIQTNNGSAAPTIADLGQTVGITAAGFTQSSDEAGPITYTASGTTFCIVGQSVTGSVFYITDNAGVQKLGTSGSLPGGCTAVTTGTLNTATK